ncbi:hypothetical protein [Demequina pelophila]|uniref:hypothetical protein n=1 Tax=Demequina pelophila TaxID=1638984 RepID=UPI000785F062|nr:hypothetical protein [Demequina pelophila]
MTEHDDTAAQRPEVAPSKPTPPRARPDDAPKLYRLKGDAVGKATGASAPASGSASGSASAPASGSASAPAPTETAPTAPSAPTPEGATSERPPAGASSPRTPGRAWPLVIAGLAILGALGYGAYLYVGEPEPIEIPAANVVAPEVVHAVDPVELEDPTAFLAAMPATFERWSMVEATTHDPADATILPGRVAEHHTLVYTNGTAEYTVEAYQLYTEEDAVKALERQPRDGDVGEHTVAGAAVGSEARRSSETDTRVMWTHGAAYLEAVGPTEGIDAFLELLAL